MNIAKDNVNVFYVKSAVKSIVPLFLVACSLVQYAAAQNGPIVKIDATHQVTLNEKLVWPHLRFQLKAAGDRLVVKNKDRSILIGAISRSTAASSPLRIVSEISGNIRVEQTGVGGPQVLLSDGKRLSTGTGSLSLSDSDLIETLSNDTAEHFFVGQMTGLPTRFYGANFRLDGGKDSKYTGPYYDAYEVGDTVVELTGALRRTKIYCLNSQTLLLERVHYKLNRGGKTVQVIVLLSGWKQFQDQQFPTKIERTEGGQTVFTVSINAAAVSPAAADGTFSIGR